MRLTFRDNRFVCISRYEERHHPAAAGFKWNRDARRWETRDREAARKLEKYATELARKALDGKIIQVYSGMVLDHTPGIEAVHRDLYRLDAKHQGGGYARLIDVVEPDHDHDRYGYDFTFERAPEPTAEDWARIEREKQADRAAAERGAEIDALRRGLDEFFWHGYWPHQEHPPIGELILDDRRNSFFRVTFHGDATAGRLCQIRHGYETEIFFRPADPEALAKIERLKNLLPPVTAP